MTYNEIASKDDKLFISACKEALGAAFSSTVRAASIDMHNAWDNEPCPLKKANKARRAANLVFLKAMTGAGVTNWREIAKIHEENRKRGKRKRSPASFKQNIAPENNPGVGYRPKNTEGRQKGFLDKLMNEADQKRKGVKHG